MTPRLHGEGTNYCGILLKDFLASLVIAVLKKLKFI